MVRGILIGLDGSPYSMAAVELALCWAERFNCLLVGLGIIDEPAIRAREPIPIGGSAFKKQRDEALLADARLKVEQFLVDFQRRCSEAGVAHRVIKDVGPPADQIVLEAQRFDIILLGQRTYFEFETRAGPDETLHEILKHSPRPVVTVLERPAQGHAVVVAYDGSLQASRAVYALAASGLAAGEAVYVVSIHQDLSEARRRSDRAVEFLALHEISARALPLIPSSDTADVLREQAWMLDAGLLVMGAYGKSLLHEFFFGSVTRGLLKDSPAPLFLAH
jgi:nucleotide-binding universal stress UspA family protein